MKRTSKKLLPVLLLIFPFLLPGVTRAADLGTDGIFYSKYREAGVAESFVAGSRWFPYPDYEDRAGWEALFGPYARDIVAEAEPLLDYEWKTIPATAYAAFVRTGDRMAMEDPEASNRLALVTLILAELAEGQGRFIDQIANGVWLAAQQFSWVASAHQMLQYGHPVPDGGSHFIELYSARYGSIVAVAYYFFHKEFDRLDPSISVSVMNALRQKILDPFLSPVDNCAWVGLSGEKIPHLNNWTPWCNTEVMLCFLLLEEDQAKLDYALDKSVRSMDIFLHSVGEDGACEEGITYWRYAAGKMYEWLQILYDASGGRFDFFDNAKVRRMGEYVSRSHVGNGYFANFADSNARIMRTIKPMIWAYGRAVGSSEMQDFALYCMGDRSTGRFEYPIRDSSEIFRSLQTVRFHPAIRARLDSLNSLAGESSFEDVLQSLTAGIPRSTWYGDLEVLYTRSDSGWSLAAKGGHNGESHNHNDTGSCILFVRGTPVLVDSGVGIYTAQTFNGQRYSIWTMQSDWHNLPSVNGASQPGGPKYRAKDVLAEPNRGSLSVDISGAYPESAACTKWVRDYSLSLDGVPSLSITDTYSLTSRSAPDVEHFLVSGQVILPGESLGGRAVSEGELLIVCGGGPVIRMTYSKSLIPSVEEKILEGNYANLAETWGPSLRRISLTSAADAPAQGRYEFRLTELDF